MADKYIITVEDNRENGSVLESKTCNDLRDAYIIRDKYCRTMLI